jgi:serine/threonine protein kinase
LWDRLRHELPRMSIEEEEGPFEPGSRVGPYNVQELVGEGPFGPVYRGYDPGQGRAVELRVVADANQDPAAVGRLRHAVPRLIGLRHPNFLELVDSGEENGACFLVVLDARGIPLRERLQNDPPRWSAAMGMLEDVAEAVDYAHTQGVAHGAVGVDAVEIRPDGRALLADLGVAINLAPDAEAYHRGLDVQDFAALAYEVLTGSPAEPGRKPRRASSLNPELGPATDAILDSALASSRHSAFVSCGQLVSELATAIRQDAAGRLPGATARRGRRWPWVVLGLLAVIAGVVAGYLLYQANNKPQPAVTVSNQSPKPGDSVTISASNLPPNQAGNIQIASNPVLLGNFRASGGGTATASVTIPTTTASGNHVLSLCWNGSCPVNTPLHVQASPTPSPSPSEEPTLVPTPEPTRRPIPITPVPGGGNPGGGNPGPATPVPGTPVPPPPATQEPVEPSPQPS